MLEWVKVVYPRVRDVYIDDELSGQTNCTLAVRQGTQQFDLGTPADYTPRRRRITVQNTAPTQPLEIFFTPKP